jgi:hypothetical protein
MPMMPSTPTPRIHRAKRAGVDSALKQKHLDELLQHLPPAAVVLVRERFGELGFRPDQQPESFRRRGLVLGDRGHHPAQPLGGLEIGHPV